MVLCSVHAQIYNSMNINAMDMELTASDVGVFSREISQLLKIRPPPSLRSHLSSLPMGVFLRDYGIMQHTCTDL